MNKKQISVIGSFVVILIMAVSVFLGNGQPADGDGGTGARDGSLAVFDTTGNAERDAEMPGNTEQGTDELESMEQGTDELESAGRGTDGLESEAEPAKADLKFRSKKLLNQHYEKHGVEMGFASAEEYEAAAAAVVANPNALHKTEQEDGDDVYYLEETNEFVIVSTDGYIRTYFLPSAGKKYYDRQ